MSEPAIVTPPTLNHPTTHLHVRKFNPNSMSPGEYALLVASIRKLGFLQSLLVRPLEGKPGHFEVVDGAHRLKAAKECGMKVVPCVVREGTEDDVAGVLQIGMNKLRGSLDLGAAGMAIADLADAGWSVPDLTVTGFTQEEITDLLNLARQTAETVLANADIPPPDVPPAPAPESFTLEIPFASADDAKRAKRALRKVAGKGGSLGDALLRTLALDV